MTRLRIPKGDYPKLRKLLHLDETLTQELIAVIEETPPTLSPRSFVSRISSRVGISTDDLDDIISVLTTLYLTRARMDLDIPDYVDVIHHTLDQINSDELRPIDGNWEAFGRRLSTLLALDPTLGVVSKASHLRTQYERTLHDVQIFTDLRPVFQADPLNPPAAGMIMHTIQISYHQNNQIKEFFVELDSEDVQHLRSLLARADQKEQSLKSLMKSASLPIVEVESDDLPS